MLLKHLGKILTYKSSTVKITDLEIIDFLRLSFLLRGTRSGRLVIDHSTESFDVVAQSYTQFFISETDASGVAIIEMKRKSLSVSVTDYI